MFERYYITIIISKYQVGFFFFFFFLIFNLNLDLTKKFLSLKHTELPLTRSNDTSDFINMLL